VRLRPNVFLFVGIILFWFVALITKLKFNGLVYGLDFGLLHPDGKLYAFRTLTMLGKTELEAGQLVSDWYSIYAYKLNNFQPESLFYDVHPLWQLYKPRVLYPLLSIPFVALLGVNGMLVVPAISMLILLCTVQLIGIKLENKFFAFILAGLISISPVVNRWMFANVTDGLLTAISCLFLVALIYFKNQNRFLIAASATVTLGSFTRTSVLEWIAIAAALFWFQQRRNSLILAFVATILFIPSAFRNFSEGILPNEKNVSILQIPVKFAESIARVGFYEIAQLVVLDRLLLVILILSFVISIMRFSLISSKLFLLVFLSLWITGAVNGTIGVNFRYQLPILPFMAYILIESSNVKFWLKPKI
jgi:hypothetical protein